MSFLTIISNEDIFDSTYLNEFVALNNLGDLEPIILSKNKAIRYKLTNAKNILTQHDLVYPVGKKESLVAVVNNYNKFKPELAIFDMDSTLIYQEVIELIAFYANVEEQVKEITDRAMNNEIDFKESLTLRCSLLKGVPLETLYSEITKKIVVTTGVPEFIKFLKAVGCKTGVISGGFEPFAKFIQSKLNLDYMKANNLEILEGTLTGGLLGEIVDGQCKAKTLLEFAKENNVEIEKTLMVGDGGNDLLAMAAAGYGVAWNAKPNVQIQAPSRLNSNTMLDIAYIFGYNDEDVKDLLKN
ncbi:hypothetical protein QEN19_001618 [Hanseniaspora menglaensis]